MSKIKLPHASGNSMSIAAPATNPASDLELKLPATVGTAGQVLSVDGSGNLVWTDNTPIWLVKMNTGSNDLTVASGTWITVPLTNEKIDTDNAFNTSNYDFTVPSGKGGKYYLYYQARINGNPDDGENVQGRILKNDSEIHTSYQTSFSAHDNQSTWVKNSWVEVLSAGDVLKMQIYHSEGSNATLDALATFFGGYKLIGG